MKSALVLEKDVASSMRMTRMLKSLGYVPASVRTPSEALNVAGAIKFDVIVTCTITTPNDRRSLTGELKRTAPEAAVVFIADHGDDYAEAQAFHYPGVSAVIKRPPSAEAIRRVIEFGLDGYGLQPGYVLASEERRRRRVEPLT